MNELLHEIIVKAASWELYLTVKEKEEMTYNEAKREVLHRIYTEYENQLTAMPVDTVKLAEKFKLFLQSEVK